MAEKLQLELITPYKKVLSEQVDMITAFGSLGEFAVLPGHASFLTSLKIGELSYLKDGETFHLALNWGYFEIVDDTVTILVETAERADEIDLERARAALGRAEEALKKLTREDKDLIVYEAALQRALIRMQVATKAARK
ncbi:MAG: F0F1 ATP synthase subunit epsilon [Deltaproteobacteria bacterium]|nr:F0F1 ATP synthase subunit epsilon [Deltaproteobacteria bacterium]TLN03444.1 MAG: F0F1 ATP synthase subunit epsilon [bacterium]